MNNTVTLTDDQMEALNNGQSITIEGKKKESEIDWEKMIGRLIMVRDHDRQDWMGPVALIRYNNNENYPCDREYPFRAGTSIYNQAKPYTGPTRPNWIEWDGGECPVGRDELVLVQMRSGGVHCYKAGAGRWSSIGFSGSDVIRYTVIKP